MIRRNFDPLERAGDIVKALRPGILLTTKAGDAVNSMVIGWGTIGSLWGKPVFVAYVRENRYTRVLLDENPEFTVNIPIGQPDRRALEICGNESGRDMDKLAAAGLTPVPPVRVSVPALLQFPLTLECRAIYRDKPADPPALPTTASRPMRMDEHVCYYGEIVAAYVIEAGE